MGFDLFGGGIAAPAFGACHLAEVVSVQDPESLARVQVRLLGFDGVGEQDAPVWARVASPFAGAEKGGFFIPDVGDEVLVVFVNGDPRFPIVAGGLWSGANKPPESLPGSSVDRWTIKSKGGSRIAIVEESSPTITIETPGGVTGTFTDEGGGKVEIKAAGTTVTIDSKGVTVDSPGKVKMTCSQLEVSAGMVKVDAAMSTFSGMVKCDILQATTVIGSTYTPGAGNVW
ncbi:MAG TPA: phage baseplate assembly protein V [Longimicrobiaceae bacterium]|jgi:uncharacterized protein involved in type VI secretion and phage assembly|nr:phage baseplate assembly protein V [Longimicrobiaceae bacterium]